MDETMHRNTTEEGEVVDSNERIDENHLPNHGDSKELSVTDYLNSEDFPTNGEDTYEEMSKDIPRYNYLTARLIGGQVLKLVHA